MSSLFRKMYRGMNALFNSRFSETFPRVEQEILDVKRVIFHQTHHQLRLQRDEKLRHGGSNDAVAAAATDSELKEQAVLDLEGSGMDEYTLPQLQTACQELLNVETRSVFESFHGVVQQLSPTESVGQRGGVLRTVNDERHWIEQNAREVLEGTHDDIGTVISNLPRDTQDGKQQRKFLETFRTELNELPSKIAQSQSNTHGKDNEYTQQSDRYIHLAISSLLQKQVGYSVLPFPSSIEHPDSGTGLFCYGRALAGSIVGFFPGMVWPREYFLADDQLLASPQFADDDELQLSLRFDDVLLDARQVPYTYSIVADRSTENVTPSNPWAMAHATNHPPPPPMTGAFINRTGKPLNNCQTVMLNYQQSTVMPKAGLVDTTKHNHQNTDADHQNYQQYIPNTYAKKPHVLGPQMLNNDVVMFGMALIATRDVTNEELFYDYRLSFAGHDDSAYPDWYTVCNEQERWRSWDESESNQKTEEQKKGDQDVLQIHQKQ